MKIRYGYCKNCQKYLFNFKHHEMAWCTSCNKSAVDIEEFYSRAIGDVEIREGEISDLIGYIREQFVWTSNYDKNMKRIEPVERLLKDLDYDHILKIIDYLSTKDVLTVGTARTINVMVNELVYRYIEYNAKASMGL
jgi:hypothetical protein